jgi:hypothetical protein
MLSRRLSVVLATLAFAVAIAAPGRAQDRGSTSQQRWSAMDNCNKQAFAHYPDYTVEGAAKRDAYVRQCLRSQRLPSWGDSGGT